MKRFYEEVAAQPVAGGWQVQLDGRPMKTQGGRPQLVPNAALGAMLAKEWAAQGEEIDPQGFAARDLVDYALDVVARDKAAAVDRLLAYAETDTLCYRADPDEPLYRRQQAEWEPVLAAFEEAEGVAMERASGVMHRPQRGETMQALRRALADAGPIELAALEQVASLAASLCIARLAADERQDPQALWRAANLEEDWQVELWGSDAEAEARREDRKARFLGAVALLRAARCDPA